MIVTTYAVPSLITLSGKTLSITTDTTSTGTGGPVCTLTRAEGFTNYVFNVASGAGLSLSDITLDGGWTVGSTTASGNYLVYNAGDLTLGSKATLQNNYNAAGYNTAGAVLSDGALVMDDGALVTGCQAQYGGGISIRKGSFTMNGGTISNCRSYRSGFDSASAVMIWGNGQVAMNGGSITGNYGRGSTDGGGAVVVESGFLALNGVSITGNYSHGPGGGVYVYKKMAASVSGATTITDNYGGCTFKDDGRYDTGGSASNLYITSTATLTVAGDLTQAIGVTSQGHVAAGDKIAVTSAEDATTVLGLSHLICDSNTELTGMAEGTGNSVIWKTSAVCQIGTTTYTSVEAAFAAITAGKATDINGNKGTEFTDYKVEMLRDWTYAQTDAVPTGKNITLTTATSVGSATITRSSAFVGSAAIAFTVDASTSLTLENITLDGGWKSTRDGTQGGWFITNNAGTVTLGSGATLQNNSCAQTASTAGAVNNAGGTVNLLSGSAITNCQAAYGGAITTNGGELNMSGGTVSKCTSTRATRYDCSSAFEVWNGAHFNMSGGSITGNAGLNAANGGGSAVVVESSSYATLTGGTISGNTGASTGGGLFASSSAHISVSGSATIKDNHGHCTYKADGSVDTTGAASNLYLDGGTYFTVADDLTGSIGVTSAGHMAATNQFAKTTAASLSTVSGLENFFADTNSGSVDDLYGMAGSDSKVVWGKGTCQIIRDVDGTPTLAGVYTSLDVACKYAQSGDTIEVFRSHTVPSAATLPATVTGVTITTAPAATPSATGAFTYQPTGSETTATVSRGSTCTGTLLDVAGTGETLAGIAFDGAGITASDALIKVESTGAVLMNDASVTNCVTTDGKGAVSVATNESLSVSGTITINGNVNDSNRSSNLVLGSGVKFDIVGALDAQSRIGVTVASANHVANYDFAIGKADDTVSAHDAAASALNGVTIDDTSPALTIGANKDGHAERVYFEPPIAFEFYKVGDTVNHTPVEGAVFHIYQWIGSGTEPGYQTDTEMANDSDNWKPVYNGAATPGKDLTSTADGMVKAPAGLPDGIFRTVETVVPDGYVSPAGQWRLVVDSNNTDPDKFVSTVVENNGESSNTHNIAWVDATDHYELLNDSAAEVVITKTMVGDYADHTLQCAFVVTETDTGTSVGTFYVAHGESVTVPGLALNTSYTITETVPGGYAVKLTSSSGPAVVGGTDTVPTVKFTGQGTEQLDFTNTYQEVVPSGVDVESAGWLFAVPALVAAVAIAGWRGLRRRKSIRC